MISLGLETSPRICVISSRISRRHASLFIHDFNLDWPPWNAILVELPDATVFSGISSSGCNVMFSLEIEEQASCIEYTDLNLYRCIDFKLSGTEKSGVK